MLNYSLVLTNLWEGR